MNVETPYQLIDFGHHEKLESFGGLVVRRETPSGGGTPRKLSLWNHPDLHYRLGGAGGVWVGEAPDPWRIKLGTLRFLLRPTPAGQVGLFPEQRVNWDWIQSLSLDLTDAKAINLFAYTGGTTMALAQRGARVVHVDSAKSVVNWARRNASESGLDESPIRWLVEDTLTFVQREARRGNRYDIVVADPPSFGRGPKGESWKIQKDFPGLLEQLAIVTNRKPRLILISCHTPGIDRVQLGAMVSAAFDTQHMKTECFDLSISTSGGVHLSAGVCFRGVRLS